MKALALVLMLLTTTGARGQWWADADLPVDGANYLILYTDTVSDELYATGNLLDNIGTTEQAMHFCVYTDGAWFTSVPFDNLVTTAIVYHDTL